MPNYPLPQEVLASALHTKDFTVSEVRNGISKRVYKLSTSDKDVILYIWQKPFEGTLTENQTPGVDYLFADGFAYFLHNTKLLTDLGVRVPQILSTGHDPQGDFDYAFTECFQGQSLDTFMQKGGDVATVAHQISAMMDKMASQTRDFYGSPLHTVPLDMPSWQLVFNFTAEELRIAATLDPEVMTIKEKVLQLMESLRSRIKAPESPSYCLIHGELTPPHLWLLKDGAGMIDIEAVKYFDREYDWAVLQFMYDGAVPLPKHLDRQKLDFYTLCLKIAYVSVGVDYLAHVDKDNAFFKGIRDSNLKALKNMTD